VPRYGIFGFVCATMCSLILTQLVLRRHRSLIYRPVLPEDDTVKGARHIGNFTTASVVSLTFLWLAASALFISGILLYTFQLSTSQGTHKLPPVDYSIVKLGKELPYSSQPGTEGRMRWLQLVWFFLGVAIPLLHIVMCGVLLYAPLTKTRLERLFFWTEVSFSWSSAEVFAVSTIFAISQVPTFGNGLIKSGCVTCYVVGASLLPELGVLLAGTVAYMGAAFWLFKLMRPVIFEGRLKEQ
jgi:hypothetical protein